MKKFISLATVFLLSICCIFSIGCNNDDKTQEQVSTIYKEAAQAVWQLLDQTPPQVSASTMSIKIPDNATETDNGASSVTSFKHNLSVMTCYVNFIGDLYANDNFVYSDKVVTFTVDDNSSGTTITYQMSLTAEIDEENGMIYSELCMSHESQGKLYMLMDIGYNFEQKTATSFRMIYYNVYQNGTETVKFLNDQKYTKEGKCYIGYIEDEGYAEALDAFEQDFATRKANGITLNHSFNEEYSTMIDLTNSLS